MWCWESGASFFNSFGGLLLSLLGNVFPDLDSAGEDSLNWSFAVGVVVSAFLFWLFFCCSGGKINKEKDVGLGNKNGYSNFSTEY